VKRTRNIPAERHGMPEDIGSLIAYLCSDLAGYLTGEYINVDGGWHRAAV
jgi:3-oxoacyl-[acyl-carrier protein] reductase